MGHNNLKPAISYQIYTESNAIQHLQNLPFLFISSSTNTKNTVWIQNRCHKILSNIYSVYACFPQIKQNAFKSTSCQYPMLSHVNVTTDWYKFVKKKICFRHRDNFLIHCGHIQLDAWTTSWLQKRTVIHLPPNVPTWCWMLISQYTVDKYNINCVFIVERELMYLSDYHTSSYLFIGNMIDVRSSHTNCIELHMYPHGYAKSAWHPDLWI